ncbi:MAG: metal-dependent hydrolase [Planctomycetes bacterium]|nr:metal-dependent hydrolase [Planctomycetota bacterium]
MCTAITHAFVAVAAGRAAYPRSVPFKFWVLAILCSAGPDLDVGLHSYGVSYDGLWGHRGLTHSLFFAASLAFIVVTWLFRTDFRFLSRAWWSFFAFFFLLTASHGFIDAFTDGGLGIAFFSPFEQSRYFMPWTPIPVPDFGLANLFTRYGLEVLVAELLYVWLPVGITAFVVHVVRRPRRTA